MAKKSSTAITQSWRTLMRRAKEAEAAGNKIKATQLRSQAGTVRRSKKWEASTKVTRSKAAKASWARRKAAPKVILAGRGEPGRGEIVGGSDWQFAEEIVRCARESGGTDIIQEHIAQRIQAARAKERTLAAEGISRAMEESQQEMDDAIVCAWLAEVEALRVSKGFVPGGVFRISALTVSKIVQALDRCGYSHQGVRKD